MSLAKTSALMINKKSAAIFNFAADFRADSNMASIFNTTCPIRSAHCDLYCAATGLRCSNLPLSSRQDRRICFNHPALVKLCNCIQHRSVYQSEFNTVFAMSILGTHLAEAKSMSGLYLHCLPAAAAYCLVTGTRSNQPASMFLPG